MIPVRSRQAGFTLLEILLVIIIMAVSAMMIAPAYFSAGSSDLERESGRLVQMLRLAHEEAALTSRPFRILLYQDAYSFASMNEQGEWKTQSKAPFQAHPLPESIMLLEPRPVQPLPEDIKAQDQAKLPLAKLPIAVVEMAADGWLPVVDLLITAADREQPVEILLRSGPGGIAVKADGSMP